MFIHRQLAGPQPAGVVCSPGTVWDQWSNACECPDGTKWDGTACVGESALETLWNAFVTAPVAPAPIVPGVPTSILTPVVVAKPSPFAFFKTPLGLLLLAGGAFAGYKIYKSRQKTA